MAGNSQRGHRALKSQRLLDPELSSLLTSKWPLQLYPCNHLPHIHPFRRPGCLVRQSLAHAPAGIVPERARCLMISGLGALCHVAAATAERRMVTRDAQSLATTPLK